jgi:hypothetical protein
MIAVNGGNDKPRHPIYVNGRVIGHVVNDTFLKLIRGSKHLLRTPWAIAFDVSSLNDAQTAGASQIVVIDTETAIVYRTPLAKVMEKGRRFNRGFGDQIFLVLDQWEQQKFSLDINPVA